MEERIPAAETISAAAESARAQLGTLQLTDQTARAMARFWARFTAYADGAGIATVSGIEPEVVRGFVYARRADGNAPSTSTMHSRRSAVRLLFRIWRELAIIDGDPTIDLVLPPRSQLGVRPLTDDEIALCRWASLATPAETRQPAAWALAEAGATTGETPRVLASHLDLESRDVWIAGSTKSDARTAPLTDWGAAQLRRRLGVVDNPDVVLCYEGQADAESRQASACKAIGDVLRRAGLASEADIRPRSVTAWVGVQVFAETGRIEEVARRLGMRSLDRAASLIGHDWRTRAVCLGGKS